MSDIIHTLSRTVKVGRSAGSPLNIAYTETLTGHRYQKVDLSVDGTADDDFIMDIDISSLQALLIWILLDGGSAYSSSAMSIGFYKAGPILDKTITVSMARPYFWTPSLGLPNPFSADIIKTHVTGAGGGGNRDGTLYMKILNAATLGV